MENQKMEDMLPLLREISEKLDSIITLLILSNRTELDKIRENLKKDKIAELLISKADGTLSYSDLVRKVAKKLQIAEITVKRKISELKSLGVLVGYRKGREVFYRVSSLFE